MSLPDVAESDPALGKFFPTQRAILVFGAIHNYAIAYHEMKVAETTVPPRLFDTHRSMTHEETVCNTRFDYLARLLGVNPDG